MTVIAIYNMKGGVGKTTTAVNLSYLAAAAGQRALLWDLDPQAASSFAFRVRPRVAGFGKRSLESGQALGDAIKQTDYGNLDLLPADFAYRKLDRLLGHLGKPARVVKSLLDTIGRDYDVVFLDCPAGFSLLTEGIFAAADAVLVPTIPTTLSLRMVARLIKWADGSGSTSELVAFLSMVDRRKALHRRACEWSAGHPDLFLTGQVPYASIVEQMAVRRMPLAVFAPRDPSTRAFAEIWRELRARAESRGQDRPRLRDRRMLLKSIDALIAQLESVDGHGPIAPVANARAVDFIHGFDTDRRDLQRCGYVLELRESTGSMIVVAARFGGESDDADSTRRVQAQIDKAWARDILSGLMSPLAALERRLGRPTPWLVESVRTTIGGRRLLRIDSRAALPRVSDGHEPPHDVQGVLSSMIRQG